MADNATDGREFRGNPDGLNSLVKYSVLPIGRIRYLPDADERVVQSIECRFPLSDGVLERNFRKGVQDTY